MENGEILLSTKVKINYIKSKTHASKDTVNL